LLLPCSRLLYCSRTAKLVLSSSFSPPSPPSVGHSSGELWRPSPLNAPSARNSRPSVTLPTC
jgi:hypothetical protein